MTNDTAERPAMRMGECPYCERAVLVYEEPPRCPICACPLEDASMRPFASRASRRPAPATSQTRDHAPPRRGCR